MNEDLERFGKACASYSKEFSLQEINQPKGYDVCSRSEALPKVPSQSPLLFLVPVVVSQLHLESIRIL